MQVTNNYTSQYLLNFLCIILYIYLLMKFLAQMPKLRQGHPLLCKQFSAINEKYNCTDKRLFANLVFVRKV